MRHRDTAIICGRWTLRRVVRQREFHRADRNLRRTPWYTGLIARVLYPKLWALGCSSSQDCASEPTTGGGPLGSSLHSRNALEGMTRSFSCRPPAHVAATPSHLSAHVHYYYSLTSAKVTTLPRSYKTLSATRYRHLTPWHLPSTGHRQYSIQHLQGKYDVSIECAPSVQLNTRSVVVLVKEYEGGLTASKML